MLRSLFLFALLGLLTGLANAEGIRLSDAQALEIGRRIWQNECGGTIAGLVTWNAGEEFPSLGIGHFIWYPKGYRGPFEESFPALVAFLTSRGHRMPTWLKGPCPWPNRKAFLDDLENARLKELRKVTAQVVPPWDHQ